MTDQGHAGWHRPIGGTVAVCLALVASLPGIASAADVAATSATSATAAPEGSAGLKEGDWLLRARIVGLVPLNETSELALIGGRIETPELILPDGEIVYFLTDHLSVEVQGGVVVSKPEIRDSLVGDLKIGSIWTAAVNGAAQYHFRPGAKLNPYVGAGISVSWPVRIEPGPGIADFDVERLISPIFQMGADYQVSDDWFANASVKYAFVPPQTFSNSGASFTSDLDTLLVGAGIGYRF